LASNVGAFAGEKPTCGNMYWRRQLRFHCSVLRDGPTYKRPRRRARQGQILMLRWMRPVARLRPKVDQLRFMGRSKVPCWREVPNSVVFEGRRRTHATGVHARCSGARFAARRCEFSYFPDAGASSWPGADMWRQVWLTPPLHAHATSSTLLSSDAPGRSRQSWFARF
jgi:hypothetical protein